MQRNTILQCNDAQVSVQLGDEYPMTDAAIFRLDFLPEGGIDCGQTPFELDIGSLDQYIIPKIFRHEVLGLLLHSHGLLVVIHRLVAVFLDQFVAFGGFQVFAHHF